MELIAAALLNAFAPVAGTILTGPVSWGLAEANRYIRTKTKNEQICGALNQIGHVIEATVQDLNQTMVKNMRKAAADGKLTQDEARDMKNDALIRVKAQLPATIQKTAALAVNSMHTYLGALIEKTVADLKK